MTDEQLFEALPGTPVGKPETEEQRKTREWLAQTWFLDQVRDQLPSGVYRRLVVVDELSPAVIYFRASIDVDELRRFGAEGWLQKCLKRMLYGLIQSVLPDMWDGHQASFELQREAFMIQMSAIVTLDPVKEKKS